MKVYLSYFILIVGSGLIVPNIVLYLEDDDGIVNWFVFSQSEVFSVALTIVSFKALFAIEGEDTLIDIDDTRSLEVVFRFVPLFFTWGCDQVLDDLGVAFMRRRLIRTCHAAKLEKYVKEGEALIKIIREDEEEQKEGADPIDTGLAAIEAILD